MSVFTLNTNLPALLVANQLQNNELNLSQSIERLSTGLRINTPADDVAGNVLANNLQSSLNLLNQGTLNAQDAISLIQIAEGGVQQITGILQQMNTLAAEAASSTQTSAGRQEIQTQVNQLLKQIDQIVETTAFGNEILLDGTLQSPEPSEPSTLAITSNSFLGAQGVTFLSTIGVSNPQLLSPSTNATCFLDEAFEFTIAASTISTSSFIVDVFASGCIVSGVPATIASEVVDFTVSAGTLTPITVPSSAPGGATFVATLNFSGLTFSDIPGIIGKTAFAETTAFQPRITVDNSVMVQVGPNVGDVIRIFAPEVLSSSLFSKQNVNVTSFLGAEGAIVQIQHALNTANEASSLLGGLQNRLQFLISNNQVMEENLTAARSNIMDLNVPQEITALVKQEILVQTTTSVLAQANLVPEIFIELIQAQNQKGVF